VAPLWFKFNLNFKFYHWHWQLEASHTSLAMSGSSDDEPDTATLASLLGEGGGHKSRRAKARAKARRGAPAPPPPPPAAPRSLPAGVTLEYEAAPVEGALEGADVAADSALAGVLTAFRRAAGVTEGGAEEEAAAAAAEEEAEGGEGAFAGDALGGAAALLPSGLTRKQRRALLQDLVTVVKSRVARPDVVEAHDVTAADPALLVHVKALRHSVPVPRHWCHLKRYLQGKRGLPRPAYQLPDFIAATGIGTLRDLDNEAAEKKSLKGKTRDRARPKLGRIEVDYAVLHDAFFVHQTKPRMTGFGELYYEGREFEKDRSGFAPGALSDRLREALGMPPRSTEEGSGGSAPPAPPPWLVNMQRYGPPPSYGGLPIAGLSAPLPVGASFGYGPGQWGAPPTDAFGFPLYGDVFGVGAGGEGAAAAGGSGGGGGGVHWGEPHTGWVSGGGGGAGAAARAAREAAALEAALAPPEAPVVAVEEAPAPAPAPAAPAVGGADTAVSAAGGGVVELRKNFQREGAAAAPPQLYAVLPERATALSGGLLGTRAVYDLSGGGGGGGAVPVAAPAGEGGAVTGAAARRTAKEVAIAIAPEELARLSEVELARKFDEETARAAAAAAAAGGDVSDLLEEQARKQKRKLAAKEEGEGAKKKKKGESFRF
jgi:splicing factor 3B subunit 2